MLIRRRGRAARRRRYHLAVADLNPHLDPFAFAADRDTPIAVVTGASSGIGRDVAERLAKRGYRTILVARRAERLTALAAQLSEHTPSFALSADLLHDADVRRLAHDALTRQFAPIDVLVNNAGFGRCKPFLEHSDEEHRQIMQVNHFAAATLMRAVLPGMLARRRGHIINVASISAKVGPWGHSAYAASKAAMICLTQSVAGEHRGSGVNFSYVLPGVIRTEFFDQPTYETMADKVRKHGISVERIGRRIERLLDRPRLEVVEPRHYRIIDFFRALSPRLAHAIVSRGSQPPAAHQTQPDTAAENQPANTSPQTEAVEAK